MMIIAIIPLLMIFIPPAFQLILSMLKAKGRVRLPLWGINILAILLGLVLPVLAMFVSMAGLAPGIKCATGCVVFAIFGWGIAIITIPLIAGFNYMMQKDDK